MSQPVAVTPDSPAALINRELSWLSFARRVLALAEDPEQPLLERVKFAGIMGMIYDEFAMKRIGGLFRQVRSGERRRGHEGLTPAEVLGAWVEIPGIQDRGPKVAQSRAQLLLRRRRHPAGRPPIGRVSRLAGTLIRTNRRFRRPGSVTSTARLRPRLLINGNGCAASAASGMRIGSTQSAKYRARKSRSAEGPWQSDSQAIGEWR